MYYRKLQRVFFLIVAFGGITLFSTACNRPTNAGTPTLDVNEVSTSAAETIAAQIVTITSQYQAGPSATQPKKISTQPTQAQISSPTSTTVILNETVEPLITPPPLPTASTFSVQVSYSNIHNCGRKPTIIFQIGNNSDIGLESSSIYIKDIATGIVLYGPDTKNAPFLDSEDNCPPGLDHLGPGGVAFIGAVIQTSLPIEGSAHAKIVICSEPSLQGVCSEIKLDFPWE
jgi:hypothetical protein